MRPTPPPHPRYWTYDLGDGWQVFAGKSAVDNDLLSLHFALPTDLWFHASAIPGSHVLLRGPEGEAASVERIHAAAAIAAWHSKARAAKRCKVDYCLARNVSKPPRGPAGEVTITHFKSLQAHPALPAPPPPPTA